GLVAFLENRRLGGGGGGESVEVEAVRMALEVAAETGCKLHVVHVTAPEAVLLIRDARLRGVDATCETCPHYLVLDETAMERSGPLAKCAPPLRPKSTVEKLWHLLAEGHIHTIGSDHSPSPPEMKTGSDFSKLWGGIAGCQHAMPLFVQAALQRGFPLEKIARLTSSTTAERFRMARKGSLEAGFDADLVLLRQVEPAPIRAENLFTRHKISPYVGLPLGAGGGSEAGDLFERESAVEGGLDEQRHGVLAACNAAPEFGKIGAGFHVRRTRRVVRANRVNVAFGEELPEFFHCGFWTQRRSAFGEWTRTLHRGFVEDKIMRAGLAGGVHAAKAGIADHKHGLGRGDMDDMELATGFGGNFERHTHGFDFDRLGTRGDIIAPGRTGWCDGTDASEFFGALGMSAENDAVTGTGLGS
ncbi:MAG: amidohydrolase family protein, partial [Spartobacteria bacterium]